jgi:small-conductance mechanosensitive channel
MNADAQQIGNDLLRVLYFPLVKLGDTEVTLVTLFKLACIIAFVLICERLLRRHLVRQFLRRTHFHPSMQYAVSKIAGYVFIAIGFYIALKLVGIDLSSLAVIAGAIGVGLGFGLQNVISNFVSGLIILAERPISLGDRVELGEVGGVVTKISLRSTTIVTNDNITIIVPNSDFITHKVTNWSYGDPKVRIRLPLGVAYGTDPERLRRLLLELANGHPMVLREPAPELFFSGFGESSLNFELAVWTVEMTSKPRRFRSELNYAIERKLRENHIEIPFPQRDLHLRSGSLATPSLAPSSLPVTTGGEVRAPGSDPVR